MIQTETDTTDIKRYKKLAKVSNICGLIAFSLAICTVILFLILIILHSMEIVLIFLWHPLEITTYVSIIPAMILGIISLITGAISTKRTKIPRRKIVVAGGILPLAVFGLIVTFIIAFGLLVAFVYFFIAKDWIG